MKTDLSYMTMDQASRILDCGKVPGIREQNARGKYLEVITVMGYTKIHGSRNLEHAPNYQLEKVAEKLSKDAQLKTRQYWDSIDQQIMMEDARDHEVQLKLRGY
ncbi:MAG TPA: hypothetical protein VJB13_02520 [Candidatus Nanoarchaeia archaeon]|nr:hypothetical protein [Candidatus Nanoarchaeia archaeon]